MRTTVEIDDAHRAELLRLAAQRGEKGFSSLIREALDLYMRQHRARREAVSKAIDLQGSFGEKEADALEASVRPPGEVAMIIADTDVLIDFLRGRGEAGRVAVELVSRSFGTTAITAFEIRSGARTARQKSAVDTLLEAMTILPFGPEEARIGAEVRQQVESQGQPIGMADYMIAAICIANDGVLLTRNLKHFERVKRLRLATR